MDGCAFLHLHAAGCFLLLLLLLLLFFPLPRRLTDDEPTKNEHKRQGRLRLWGLKSAASAIGIPQCDAPGRSRAMPEKEGSTQTPPPRRQPSIRSFTTDCQHSFIPSTDA
ncbi:hypothetical protein LX36DRAFT_660634 [Colletotrichum falcatum]|nr:hypothetical protein LX36DRAFT_660634 [Colletotrichum falcatum]